jgi:hypothetical protein
VFGCGVKEEEGGRGHGWVGVEEEERASAASLPAHGIEVEVEEGAVKPQTDAPKRRAL